MKLKRLRNTRKGWTIRLSISLSISQSLQHVLREPFKVLMQKYFFKLATILEHGPNAGSAAEVKENAKKLKY